MALVFPRDMTSARLWQASSRIVLARRQEISRTSRGEAFGKDIGPAIWAGQFLSAPLQAPAAEALLADFESLGGLTRTFYASPPERPRASSGSAPGPLAIDSISGDNSAVALSGLPAAFEVSVGDYFSVETAGGARHLHKFVEAGTADGSGLSPELTVEPYIRIGAAVADVVTMDAPLVEMRLDAGSLRKESASGGALFTVGFTCTEAPA